MKTAKFHCLEYDTKNKIVFLQDDADFFGSIPIEEDTGTVVIYWWKMYGEPVRVIFKGASNKWHEIKYNRTKPIWASNTFTVHKWHGHMWDALDG